MADISDDGRRRQVAMRFPPALLEVVESSQRRGESRHDAILRFVAAGVISEQRAATDRAQEMFDD